MLVTATAGERGLAGDGGRRRRRPGPTPERRARRVRAPARLRPGRGARLRRLRAASRPGRHRRPSPTRTSRRPPARLAVLLREEQADVLTIYDRNGGYGHPDHVQVHRVGDPRRPARRHARGPGGDRARSPVPVGCSGSSRSSATRSGGSAPLGTTGCLRQPRRDHPPGRRRRGARPQARGDGRARLAAARRRTRTRALDRFVRLPLPLFAAGVRPRVVRRAGPTRPASRLDDVFASLRCSTTYEDDPVLLHPTDDGDLDAAK